MIRRIAPLADWALHLAWLLANCLDERTWSHFPGEERGRCLRSQQQVLDPQF